jgi:hypothetical protein
VQLKLSGANPRSVDCDCGRTIKAGMTTNSLGRMAVALWVGVVLLEFPGTAVAADSQPAPVAMGDNTYSLTRRAGFAFIRNTTQLEKEARADATEFCASLGRKMKEVSISSQKASPIFGGISQATIVFKALDPADPELAGTQASAANTPALAAGAGDLEKLAGLHDRKLLSDSEYEDATKRLKERLNNLDQLVELHRKGVLTDAEFEAARRRLMEHAP